MEAVRILWFWGFTLFMVVVVDMLIYPEDWGNEK